MTEHRLRVTLLGPERTVETQWGPRQESDTLATLDVLVDAGRGWAIYQEAVRRSLAPDAILTMPTTMSAEEAEQWHAEWTKKHRG